MGHILAGSKGVQVGSTFFLTPAPVLAESVAAGGGGEGRGEEPGTASPLYSSPGPLGQR